jgi:peptidoglycan/xylan/chitin deacetylase (PgdA/CDA1 family)
MLATDDRSTDPALLEGPDLEGVEQHARATRWDEGARHGAAARLAGAGALAFAIHAAPALSFYLPPLRRALGIEDRTACGRGYALTFDDGPHPQGTPAVLEILAAAHVRATFFLVGEQVRRNPALVREILAAGHDIGVHCDRHRNLLRLTPWQVREDLARAQEDIECHSERASALYRPPYGILNASALAIARRCGWRTLLWTHWGRDWELRATAESIAALVTAGVGHGSVLLLHDADDYSAPSSWRRTVAALPRVLETLHERGLQAVGL